MNAFEIAFEIAPKKIMSLIYELLLISANSAVKWSPLLILAIHCFASIGFILNRSWFHIVTTPIVAKDSFLHRVQTKLGHD
jgi:hypothetical protein